MADTPKQDRELGLSRTRLGNRFVTAYDPALALQIVEKIAEGETLTKVCTKENKLPSKQTFLKWVAREPELAAAYRAAQAISALSFEEEALDTARNVRKNPGTAQNVRAAEVLINQLRWSASRRDPAKYGDKAQTNVIVPIHINTSLDLGAGSEHQADIPDIYTLELQAVQEGSQQDSSEVQDIPRSPGLVDQIKAPKPRKTVLTPRMPMDVSVVEEKRRLKSEKEGQ